MVEKRRSEAGINERLQLGYRGWIGFRQRLSNLFLQPLGQIPVGCRKEFVFGVEVMADHPERQVGFRGNGSNASVADPVHAQPAKRCFDKLLAPDAAGWICESAKLSVGPGFFSFLVSGGGGRG